MGTWGTGTFENDAACDFAAEVADNSNLALIEKALSRVIDAGTDYLEAPVAAEGLAAADIVARLAGRLGEQTPYTETIDKWVAKMKIAPSPALLEKAKQAVARTASEPSELLELWAESGELKSWQDSVNQLLSRL